MKKLYTKIKRDNKDTVKSFIVKLYGSRGYGCVETYKDPGCTESECTSGRNRSFDALYQICKTRFPNLTEKTFLIQLHNFISSKRGNIAALYCDTINRWVIMRSGYDKEDLHKKGLIYNYMNSIHKLHITGSGTFCANSMLKAVGLIE